MQNYLSLVNFIFTHQISYFTVNFVHKVKNSIKTDTCTILNSDTNSDNARQLQFGIL